MHACLWQVLFRRFLIVIFFVSSNTFDCDVTIGLELMHILFLNIIFSKLMVLICSHIIKNGR